MKLERIISIKGGRAQTQSGFFNVIGNASFAAGQIVPGFDGHVIGRVNSTSRRPVWVTSPASQDSEITGNFLVVYGDGSFDLRDKNFKTTAQGTLTYWPEDLADSAIRTYFAYNGEAEEFYLLCAVYADTDIDYVCVDLKTGETKFSVNGYTPYSAVGFYFEAVGNGQVKWGGIWHPDTNYYIRNYTNDTVAETIVSSADACPSLSGFSEELDKTLAAVGEARTIEPVHTTMYGLDDAGCAARAIGALTDLNQFVSAEIEINDNGAISTTVTANDPETVSASFASLIFGNPKTGQIYAQAELTQEVPVVVDTEVQNSTVHSRVSVDGINYTESTNPAYYPPIFYGGRKCAVDVEQYFPGFEFSYCAEPEDDATRAQRQSDLMIAGSTAALPSDPQDDDLHVRNTAVLGTNKYWQTLYKAADGTWVTQGVDPDQATSSTAGLIVVGPTDVAPYPRVEQLASEVSTNEDYDPAVDQGPEAISVTKTLRELIGMGVSYVGNLVGKSVEEVTHATATLRANEKYFVSGMDVVDTAVRDSTSPAKRSLFAAYQFTIGRLHYGTPNKAAAAVTKSVRDEPVAAGSVSTPYASSGRKYTVSLKIDSDGEKVCVGDTTLGMSLYYPIAVAEIDGGVAVVSQGYLGLTINNKFVEGGDGNTHLWGAAINTQLQEISSNFDIASIGNITD